MMNELTIIIIEKRLHNPELIINLEHDILLAPNQIKGFIFEYQVAILSYA